jgi:hypothetical protein
VEYKLARNAVIREFRKGRLSRLDVCDAHPELIRAAVHLGAPVGDQCPICEEVELVEVTFVFGSRLPAGGRCVATKAELARYWRRKDPRWPASPSGATSAGRAPRVGAKWNLFQFWSREGG